MVSGSLNPADIPTRVCDVGDFGRWFSGPPFLYEADFDVVDFDAERKLNMADVVVESRKVERLHDGIAMNVGIECGDDLKDELSSYGFEVISCVAAEHVQFTSGEENTKFNQVKKLISDVIDVTNYSSLKKLITVTGFVLRFINNIKARVHNKEEEIINEDYLTVVEYENSLRLWVISEQFVLRERCDFNKIKMSLNLFDDAERLLRLKGRFGNSSLEYDVKYPILLRSGQSYFTKLIVQDAHDKVLHHGVESSLNFVRAKYWMIKGRKTVKDILLNCVICKKYQGRTFLPPDTPDLPEFRLDTSYSFCNVGLDYAGPLYVRNDTKDAVMKVYLLLFTCASSRAVHLELVPNMTSQVFIRAFTRFTARKGIPKLVVHDNFKTFYSRDVKRYLTSQGVKQHFILPASPWWGGFYERLVRSVKLSLRKSLGRSLLSYEELETVICQVESIINCRPLTYVSSDNLEETLTPFHLMFGRNILQSSSYRQKTNTDEQMNVDDSVKRVNYMRTLISHYWKQFSSSYLNELRQQNIYRNKLTRGSTSQPLQLGDVVLIRDDTPLPRQK